MRGILAPPQKRGMTGDKVEAGMPRHTYRYVIVEADTRTLEMAVSLFTVYWGALFSLARFGVPVRTWANFMALDVFGSPFWCILFVAGGSFQAIAIHYRYPKWRRLAAAVTCALWCGCATAFAGNGGVSIVAAVAIAFAVFSAWIMWHRESAA